MSQAERLRVAWQYEENTPQCHNCVAYRRARIAHDERGAVIAQRAICGKGKFEIHPTGCCSKWSSRTGERLT
jgi:hypothetical protein